MHKVSRSQFCGRKRSFQEFELDGLIDKPPVPATHPQQNPEATKDRIIS